MKMDRLHTCGEAEGPRLDDLREMQKQRLQEVETRTEKYDQEQAQLEIDFPALREHRPRLEAIRERLIEADKVSDINDFRLVIREILDEGSHSLFEELQPLLLDLWRKDDKRFQWMMARMIYPFVGVHAAPVPFILEEISSLHEDEQGAYQDLGIRDLTSGEGVKFRLFLDYIHQDYSKRVDFKALNSVDRVTAWVKQSIRHVLGLNEMTSVQEEKSPVVCRTHELLEGGEEVDSNVLDSVTPYFEKVCVITAVSRDIFNHFGKKIMHERGAERAS